MQALARRRQQIDHQAVLRVARIPFRYGHSRIQPPKPMKALAATKLG
jgi:hypothetical protein